MGQLYKRYQDDWNVSQHDKASWNDSYDRGAKVINEIRDRFSRDTGFPAALARIPQIMIPGSPFSLKFEEDCIRVSAGLKLSGGKTNESKFSLKLGSMNLEVCTDPVKQKVLVRTYFESPYGTAKVGMERETQFGGPGGTNATDRPVGYQKGDKPPDPRDLFDPKRPRQAPVQGTGERTLIP